MQDILVPLRRGSDGAPLFVVPSAGATPYGLVRFARSLGGAFAVYSFFDPALEPGGQAYASVEETAAAYLDLARNVVGPGAPLHLAGHCAGGVVAFEMARQSSGAGGDVGALVMMDTIAPRLAVDDDPDSDASTRHDHEGAINDLVSKCYTNLAQIPAEDLAHFQAYTENQLGATARYRAQSCPVQIAQIASATFPKTVYSDWERVSESPMRLLGVQGDTSTMLEPPVVAEVARLTTQVIAEATA